MGIVERIKTWVGKIVINQMKRSSPIIADLLDNPQNLKFEGSIVNEDQISITITRKGEPE